MVWLACLGRCWSPARWQRRSRGRIALAARSLGFLGSWLSEHRTASTGIWAAAVRVWPACRRARPWFFIDIKESFLSIGPAGVAQSVSEADKIRAVGPALDRPDSTSTPVTRAINGVQVR